MAASTGAAASLAAAVAALPTDERKALDTAAVYLASVQDASSVLAMLSPPPVKSGDLERYLKDRDVENASSSADERKALAAGWYTLALARMAELVASPSSLGAASVTPLSGSGKSVWPAFVAASGDAQLDRAKMTMFRELTRTFQGGVFDDWLVSVHDALETLGSKITPDLYCQLIKSRVSDEIAATALYQVPLRETVQQLSFDYAAELEETVHDRWHELRQKAGEDVATFSRRFRYEAKRMERCGTVLNASAMRTAFLVRVRASLARSVKAMLPGSSDFAAILRAAKLAEADEKRDQVILNKQARNMVAAPIQVQTGPTGRAGAHRREATRPGRNRKQDCPEGKDCAAMRAGSCSKWHPRCKDDSCPGSVVCGKFHGGGRTATTGQRTGVGRLHVGAIVTAAAAKAMIIKEVKDDEGGVFRIGRDGGANHVFMNARLARALHSELTPAELPVARFGGTTVCRWTAELRVGAYTFTAGVVPVLLPGVDVDVLMHDTDFDRVFGAHVVAAAAQSETALEALASTLRAELVQVRDKTCHGPAKLMPLTLRLTDPEVVVRVRPRSYRPDVALEVDAWLQQALADGEVEPDSEPGGFETPLVIVRKKNGAIRPTQDCSRINGFLQMPAVPMPCMWDVLPTLGDDKGMLFSEIDVAKAFHQMPLHESSRRITAFRWRGDRYHWTTSLMGASPVPQEFQLRMEKHVVEHPQLQAALKTTRSKIFVFVDNVLIATMSGARRSERHAEMLRALFDVFVQLNLQPNVDDSTLAVERLEFLIFSLGDTVELHPRLVAKLRNAKPPTTKAELSAFLGLANLLRAFQPGLSHVLEPLQRAGRELRLKWDAACQTAFAQITGALTLPSTLERWPSIHDGAHLKVFTDASDIAIAMVITNMESGPLVYWSRMLDSTQRSWTIQERELYAVFVALTHFRNLLLAAVLHLFVDNQNVVANEAKVIDGDSDKVARWKEAIQAFCIQKWYYVRSEDNPSDFWCRNGAQIEVLEEPIVAAAVVQEDMVEEPQAVVAAADVVDEKEADDGDGKELDDMLLATPFTLEVIVQEQKKDLEVLHNNSLRHKRIGNLHVLLTDTESIKILLPGSLLMQAIEWAHTGHRSANTMMNRLSIFSYPQLAKRVRQWLKDCDACMQVNPYPAHARPAWRARNQADDANTWHIDYTDGTLLVIVDARSSFVMAERVPTATQEHSVKTLKKYVQLYGAPHIVVSDNGQHFLGSFTEHCAEQGITHSRVLPGNSQANGKVEVANRVLKRMLEKGLSLDQALHAHNHLPTTVGIVPAKVFLGRTAPTGWIGTLFPQGLEDVKDMLEEARKKYEGNPAAARADYPVIAVNQLVYRCEDQALGANKYKGPYLTLDVSHAEYVVARHLRTGDQTNLHRARIKPGNVAVENIAPADEEAQPLAHDVGVFNIDRIIGHRRQGDRLQYKVRWSGYGADHDSYLPPEDVSEVAQWVYLNKLRRN